MRKIRWKRMLNVITSVTTGVLAACIFWYGITLAVSGESIVGADIPYLTLVEILLLLLIKLLLGWLPDYGGVIRFDGRDARDFTPEQLQQQMSYIEQNVFLFNATIRDNITLGGTFTDAQMEKALRDSALAGDLASMPDGLDTAVGEEGGSLSGGQKQRVAIARALIHDRSILLVDEGTSALDQKNADIVEKSLLANPELTLILVSHHLTPERKEQFTQVYDLQPVTPRLQSA